MKVVKNLKELNSLTMAKPERIRKDSEEEMTQMSCGMILRETFGEDASHQGGHLHATQGINQAVLSLQKGGSDFSASNRVHNQLRSLGIEYEMDGNEFFTQRHEGV